jgi:hypothetical protein
MSSIDDGTSISRRALRPSLAACARFGAQQGLTLNHHITNRGRHVVEFDTDARRQ